MSILKQTGDGDIDLSTHTAVLSTGGEELAYRMRNRVFSVRGEWFADARVGIPWFDIVFLKNPNVGLIESVFDQALRALPGLATLAVVATFDKAARNLDIAFEATADLGEKITGGLGTPFIVENA